LPGRKPSSDHHLVIGRVIAVHIDDAAVTTDGRIDVVKLRPIARLGYKDYVSVQETFEMEKRTPEDRLVAERIAPVRIVPNVAGHRSD
jgi:hypothetical protein